MCVIDHLGLRLTAMPLLPLKKILYGSSDAMKSINADKKFHKAMKYIAKEVHLAEHFIGFATGVKLYTAGDVKVMLAQITDIIY